MSLLQVQNISHAFDYLLFENVHFDLAPKESMAILGVSGSGKSTLLHICSTLLKPNNGEVILCDHNIYHDNDDARLKLRRYDVGIIFQSHYLFKGFFANENIELASFISDKTIDKGILERLGIADFMHYRVGDLSGGQQQRVSIARVLAKKPKIICTHTFNTISFTWVLSVMPAMPPLFQVAAIVPAPWVPWLSSSPVQISLLFETKFQPFTSST